MSYQDGWAAINLEMPPRVPRTEYSVRSHWDLLKVVTGIDVSYESSDEIKAKAQSIFFQKWNWDFFWRILFNGHIFDSYRATMGHAVYSAGGVDYDNHVQCPFKTPQEVLEFDFQNTYGSPDKKSLKKQFEDDYKRECREHPDGVNMTGIYVTCISGLVDIFGWDMLLLAAGTDPVAFGRLINRYAVWMQTYFDALAEADVPVVMVHDDMVWTSGPFINPDWYREYVFPNYKKYFRGLIDSGKKIMFTSDGNYTEFIDDIAKCGIHGFVMEPMTDMKYIAEKYGKTHCFLGNADTRVLLNGSKEDIRAEVKRCMDIGKKCPGFFMCVGNHIPANTPVENALYYNDVYMEMSKR
jgi:hypothetical protein